MDTIEIDIPEPRKIIKTKPIVKTLIIPKKGDKGEPGKDGRDGKDGKDGIGKDGKTPTKTELKALIKEAFPEDKLILKVISKMPKEEIDLIEIGEDQGGQWISKNGKKMYIKSVSNIGAGMSSGVYDFIALRDTPDTYVGQAGKFAKVKADETGLEFAAGDGTGTVTSVATAGLISGGPITTTGTITTSMSTNKLVGRGTAGTGVMEEITLGTGLSLSGTTLNGPDLSGYVPYTGATSDVNIGTHTLIAHAIKGDASDGILFEANNGTDVALFGASGGSNATFYGGVNITGNLTVDTNVLYVDTSTDRVGIGGAPTRKLTVLDTNPIVAYFKNSTAGSYTNLLLEADTSAAYFQFNTNSATRAGTWGGVTLASSTFLETGGGTQVYYTSTNNKPFVWLQTTSGSPVERMRIDTTGYVGIGTSSPAYKFHVAGNNLIAQMGGDPAVVAFGEPTTTGAFVGGYYANAGGFSTIYYGQNGYYNGTNFVQPNTASASAFYLIQTGAHAWYSQTAGNATNSLGTLLGAWQSTQLTIYTNVSVQGANPLLYIQNTTDTSGFKATGIITRTRATNRYISQYINGGQNDSSFANPGIITFTVLEYTNSTYTSLATPTEFSGWNLQYYNGSAYASLLRIHTSGIYIGAPSATSAPSAKLHVISTTEQQRLGYDASNYFSTTVASNGAVTLNAVGSGASFNFSDNVNPTTNDGASLGTSSLSWSDLFLASGAVINFNAGDVTITHSSNTLSFAGASTGYAFADGDIYASSDNTIALGKAGNAFADLFLGDGGVISWNSANVTLTHSSGLLTLAGGLDIQGSLQCDSIVNDTGLAQSTYTPTATGVNNISSISVSECQYIRVGNMVYVSGLVDVTASANNNQTSFRLSLPISSNFGNTYECSGSGYTTNNSTAGNGLSVTADTSYDEAYFDYYEIHGTTITFSYHYSYRVL